MPHVDPRQPSPQWGAADISVSPDPGGTRLPGDGVWQTWSPGPARQVGTGWLASEPAGWRCRWVRGEVGVPCCQSCDSGAQGWGGESAETPASPEKSSGLKEAGRGTLERLRLHHGPGGLSEQEGVRPPRMALLKTHGMKSQPPSPPASLSPGELGAASGKAWGPQRPGTFPGEWPSARVARVSRGPY